MGPCPSPRTDTVAVIVAYNPDLATVRRAVESVAPQVWRVVVVDNSAEGGGFAHWEGAPGNLHVLRNGRNLGVAAALNQGIQWARHAGATFGLLLDQDSVVSEGMPGALREAYEALSGECRVAAVGPGFVDERTGRPAPFVKIGFPLNRKLAWSTHDRIECDFLITSGTLLPLAVIAEVGGMDEGLFIDNVDLEWSFRARARGFRLFGVGAATMLHSIGDGVRSLPLGLGEVVVHPPIRLYFMMRNRVLLYRRIETPAIWALQDLPRLMVKLLRFSVLVPPRLANARWMLRGLLDGLRGRQGPAPQGD